MVAVISGTLRRGFLPDSVRWTFAGLAGGQLLKSFPLLDLWLVIRGEICLPFGVKGDTPVSDEHARFLECMEPCWLRL